MFQQRATQTERELLLLANKVEVFESREGDLDFREIKAVLEFHNLEAMGREGVF